MSRELSAFISAALSDPSLDPFIAVDLEFDSPSEVYLWTGSGSQGINGTTYIGAGEVMSFSEIAESAEVEAIGVSVTLSGLSNSILVAALSLPYQGRIGRIHFGLRSNPDAMIEIFTGYLDRMPIDEAAGGSTITIGIENRLIDLERPRVRKFTHAFQISQYPGDTGLGYVAGIQDQKLPWGLGVAG